MPTIRWKDERVGWLRDGLATCDEHRTDQAVPLYRSNIMPYWQSCNICNRPLVKGRAGWPQLFEGGKGVAI